MSTFTPSNAIDLSKEKEWPASLGGLDWDTTRIVFTKRTLLEFLRYTGTTVNPNFSNIGKLPRYAQFMNVTAGAPSAIADAGATTLEAVKPTPRARDQQTDPFGLKNAIVDDDALAKAPLQGVEAVPVERLVSTTQALDLETSVATPPADNIAVARPESGQASEFKPSRRVRTGPGGNGSLSTFWGDEDAPPEPFKPSRRVRQGPGGPSSMDGVF